MVITLGLSQVKKERKNLERKNNRNTFITMYFVVARLAPGKSLFQRSRTHTSAVESTFLDYKLCKALQNPLGKYITHYLVINLKITVCVQLAIKRTLQENFEFHQVFILLL